MVPNYTRIFRRCFFAAVKVPQVYYAFNGLSVLQDSYIRVSAVKTIPPKIPSNFREQKSSNILFGGNSPSIRPEWEGGKKRSSFVVFFFFFFYLAKHSIRIVKTRPFIVVYVYVLSTLLIMPHLFPS